MLPNNLNNSKQTIDISKLSEFEKNIPELSESEKSIFDSPIKDSSINKHFPNLGDSHRIKPTSALAAFKAMLRAAFNTIHNAFFGQHNHKTPITNIKDSNTPNAVSLKDKIQYESITTQEKISLPDKNIQKIKSEDFIDDFEMNINDKNNDEIEIEREKKEENIFLEATRLIDGRTDEVGSKNYVEFNNWYKNGAHLDDIPDDAIPYAKYLIRAHTNEEKIDDIPKLKQIVGAAKNLIKKIEKNNEEKNQKELLELSNLSNAIRNELNNEISGKNKYINNWLGYLIQAFYPDNGSNKDNPEILQTKNDAKVFLEWRDNWLTAVNGGNKEIFNTIYPTSIEDLEACNQFISKYESILENSSSEQREDIENLNLQEGIKGFKEFYALEKDNFNSKKIQQAAVVEEVNLEASSTFIELKETSQSKAIKDISRVLPGIIAFQSLAEKEIESMRSILAPQLTLQSFQAMISEAKSYFHNLSNELETDDSQRIAAMSVATLWTKLTVNNQSRTSKPEESNLFSQFFSRDLLAELKALPNFEQLDTLLKVQKISNDFK